MSHDALVAVEGHLASSYEPSAPQRKARCRSDGYSSGDSARRRAGLAITACRAIDGNRVRARP